MANKLIVAPAPHVQSAQSTASIMRDVIVALMPALVVSTVVFGMDVLRVVALSVALWRSARSVVSDVDETSTWTFLTLVAIAVLGVTEPITATPVGWFLLTLVLCRAPRRDPEDAPRHPRRPRAQPATSSPPRPAPNDSPEGAR